jgi:hypothetical protein
MSDEEDLKRLIKAVYSPVSPPPGLRECLRERLTLEAAEGMRAGRSLPGHPKVWLTVAIGLISGAIGYSAWLSLRLAPMLLH